MKKQINLGEDKVHTIFWKYAIPSIIAMLAQTTAGFIDSMFIGRFIGPEGLSAITLFFPFVILLIGVGAMFAIGSSTLAGIELGKGNPEKSNNFFNLALWTLTILSISASVIIMLNMGNIADVLKVTGITKQYIFDYGNTISIFFVFFMLNFAFTFFLKLDGNPSAVVKITVSGTIINVLLDYLFVVVFKWSLQGAALATGLSQLVPWSLFIYVTIKNSKWKFKRPQIIKSEIIAIIFNGSSELLSNTAYAISGFLFNIIIMNKIGVLGVAAYAVALQITAVASSIGYGFGESNQTGVSFNIGASKLDRVKQFRHLTTKANLVAGLMLFTLTFFFGKNAANIFITDKETLILASDILKYYAFAYIVMGTNISIGTYYTAINDPVISGGVTFYRSFIGLLIGLTIFPMLFGDKGIWMAILFAEYTTFAISMYLYQKKPFGLNIKENSIDAKLIA